MCVRMYACIRVLAIIFVIEVVQKKICTKICRDPQHVLAHRYAFFFLSKRRIYTYGVHASMTEYERLKEEKKKEKKNKEKEEKIKHLRIQFIHAIRCSPWFRLNSYVPLNAMGSSSILSR